MSVAHVDLVDVRHVVAKLRLTLDVDLPGASKNVEVVDVMTAQR